MENWEKQQNIELIKDKCIRHGDFTLHSGQKTTWICDLLLAQNHFRSLMASLRPNYTRQWGLNWAGFC